MIDRRTFAARLHGWIGAGMVLVSLPAAAAQPPDTTVARGAPAGLTPKGYLSLRYAYVGSSAAATAYSGLRVTGSFQLAAFSDKIVVTYRSHHWVSLRHTDRSVLESPFENRNILQSVAIETNGLFARGVTTRMGRFFPEIGYGSSPVIDGGAVAFERAGISVGAAAGRTLDSWDGKEASSDVLVAGQVQYRAPRARMSAAYQTSSYLGVRQKEAPAGITLLLTKHLWLETYGAYDFAFKELVRGGLGVSWRTDRGSLSLGASRWRNPFDQLYLADKARSAPYFGFGAATVPAAYNDLRVSGSYGRGRWSARGTFSAMGGVRSGWTASAYLAAPPLKGFRASVGAQGMRTDYIEFYSLDATVTVRYRAFDLQLQSQTRNYDWRPRPSGLHNTDNYSELSIEYPLRKHVYLSAAGGGFFRKIGDEGFKPQAELRLIARL